MKAILVTLLIAAALPLHSSAQITQLKVMSFNIWIQGGLSLSNCIEVIRTSGADIVGLQECNVATAQTIATRLGFFVQADPSYSIVSRYPIVAAIPTSGGRGVTVQLAPAQRAHFFNTHLTAYPYGPYSLKDGASQSVIVAQEYETRMEALTNLLAAMAPHIVTTEPCFLVGDFNAPSHFDYTSFPWPTSIACTNAGLVDSYQQLHSSNRKFPGAFAYNQPGITWTPKTNQEPEGVYDRIDFVHYSPGDGAVATQSMELDERNSINPWPSDHRAVLTTFALTPAPLIDKASNPVPGNGATGIPIPAMLSWLPGSNATSQVVYLGTNSPGTLLTTTNATSLTLSNLTGATKYFWRVDTTTTSGTVTGDVWSFTTKSTNVAVYEWNFRSGNLEPTLGNGVLAYADGTVTAGLTSFGTTDGSTIPHILGKPAKYLRAPAFTAPANGYRVTFPDTGPNGGGAYVNQYTLIFDLLLPGTRNWFPFFNTAPDNGNDADFYVAPDGSLGIAAIGYSSLNIFSANTWYRVAFAADLAAGTAKYYLDGNQVASGPAGLDDRFALYSNADPGADLLLFNEGDSSGVYTHAVILSSFLFTARTMTAQEILALGSPKARGILSPAPPIRVSVALQGANVNLSWTGGEAPYQLQKTDTLGNISWQNVGAATNGTNVILLHDGTERFFRVSGS